MMQTFQVGLILTCLALFAGVSDAQLQERVIGDGVPDVIEVSEGFETFLTSVGEITRPAGCLIVDTDGADMVALSIEGTNVIDNLPDNGNYLTGATAFLPDPLAPPMFASSWVDEYIVGRNQWTRTSPMDTDGFVGVVGEHSSDPFGLFPNLCLATIDAFAGQSHVGSNVIFETSAMGRFATKEGTMGPVYSTVPEPIPTRLFAIALLGLPWLLRSFS